MEEKYFIINNANQYYVIIKCSEQQLKDYQNYGKQVCCTNYGALDLFKLSEWLINRKIKHTAIFGNIKNIFVKLDIQRQLDIILPKAINNDLFISNEDLEKLLAINNDKKSEYFWLQS